MFLLWWCLDAICNSISCSFRCSVRSGRPRRREKWKWEQHLWQFKIFNVFLQPFPFLKFSFFQIIWLPDSNHLLPCLFHNYSWHLKPANQCSVRLGRPWKVCLTNGHADSRSWICLQTKQQKVLHQSCKWWIQLKHILTHFHRALLPPFLLSQLDAVCRSWKDFSQWGLIVCIHFLHHATCRTINQFTMTTLNYCWHW